MARGWAACLVAAWAACAAAGDADEEPFGYQLHSYNDMRQWDVVAAKARFTTATGAVHTKIDPHYVLNRSFCARHGFSTAGCLVFSHDAPDMGATYNTSKQLPAALPAFAHGTVALCGKYGGIAPLLCWDKWFLDAVDDMLKAATPVAMQHNITLLLDGALSPKNGACLHGRWEPWNSTYTPGLGRDPPEAATSDADYYRRYEVLNMECCGDSVKAAAALNPPFGKFAARRAPYQLWEPMGEAAIRSVRDVYLNATAGAGARHPFLFAINQDPLAWRNYLASEAVAPESRRRPPPLQHPLAAPAEEVESSFHVASVNLTVWSNGSWVFATSDGVTRPIGVGTQLRAAAVASLPPNGTLLFTATNGYCYNSEMYNKRPHPRQCDQTPVPQLNVMTYTLTTPEALKGHMLNPSAPLAMHACNAAVLHGAFGIGSAPAPSLSGTRVHITYEPLREVNSTTCPQVCGCPEPRSGEGRWGFAVDLTARAM